MTNKYTEREIELQIKLSETIALLANSLAGLFPEARDIANTPIVVSDSNCCGKTYIKYNGRAELYLCPHQVAGDML